MLTIPPHHRAIIIGGSLNGLVTAQLLSAYFKEVVILERDELLDEPNYRPGTPQTTHVHILLVHGKQLLEHIFPGLTSELQQHGAPIFDWIEECWLFNLGGWMPRFASDQLTVAASRPLLEWVIRRRVLALKNVQLYPKSKAAGLVEQEGQIRGVILENQVVIEGNFVVDASGRTSQASQWLKELGYGEVAQTILDPQAGYATGRFEIPPEAKDKWQVLAVRATPPHNSRNGLVFPVENKQWVITLIGSGGDYPPTDEAGFVEFTRHLPNPLVYEVLQKAKLISKISGFRHTQNRVYHFEKMARYPTGLAILGDAVCALNPAYGQGMTVGVKGAILLEKIVAQYQAQPALWGVKFQKALASQNWVPWLMSTSEDFRIQGSAAGWGTRWLHWYLDQILHLCAHDPQLYYDFVQTVQMTNSPWRLARPRHLWQIGKQWLSIMR